MHKHFAVIQLSSGKTTIVEMEDGLGNQEVIDQISLMIQSINKSKKVAVRNITVFQTTGIIEFNVKTDRKELELVADPTIFCLS